MLIFIIGLVLIILCLNGVLNKSVYAGFGGGLALVGLVNIFRYIRYRRDPEYREQIDVAMTDERLKYIRMKAWSITGYLTVIVAAIGMVFALVKQQELLAEILSFVVCGMMLAYFVLYYVLCRKN